MSLRGRPSPVHRPGRDDQRVGGVQPAGHADHHLRASSMRPQPLLQPGDLDVVGLVAVLLQPGRVGRHEREPLDLPAQPDVAVRRVEAELDRAGRRRCARAWWRRLSSNVPIRSRSARSRSRSTSATERRAPFGEPLGSRPAARRSRRSWSGRPRPGRWSTRPHPPRRRRRRPGSATTPSGTAVAGPRRGRR